MSNRTVTVDLQQQIRVSFNVNGKAKQQAHRTL